MRSPPRMSAVTPGCTRIPQCSLQHYEWATWRLPLLIAATGSGLFTANFSHELSERCAATDSVHVAGTYRVSRSKRKWERSSPFAGLLNDCLDMATMTGAVLRLVIPLLLTTSCQAGTYGSRHLQSYYPITHRQHNLIND